MVLSLCTFSDYHAGDQKDDYLPIFCGWWGVDLEAGVFRDYLLGNYAVTHVSEYVHVGSLSDHVIIMLRILSIYKIHYLFLLSAIVLSQLLRLVFFFLMFFVRILVMVLMLLTS